jgi:hypothetical protein
MAIQYPQVLNITRSADVRWSERDTMLYALGLGASPSSLTGFDYRQAVSRPPSPSPA